MTLGLNFPHIVVLTRIVRKRSRDRLIAARSSHCRLGRECIELAHTATRNGFWHFDAGKTRAIEFVVGGSGQMGIDASTGLIPLLPETDRYCSASHLDQRKECKRVWPANPIAGNSTSTAAISPSRLSIAFGRGLTKARFRRLGLPPMALLVTAPMRMPGGNGAPHAITSPEQQDPDRPEHKPESKDGHEAATAIAQSSSRSPRCTRHDGRPLETGIIR